MAWNDTRFIRLTAPDDYAQHIDLEHPTSTLTGFVLECIRRGYKVSIRYSIERDGYCVTTTGTEDATINAGCVLSAWGGSVDACIGKLAYIIMYLCEDESWEVVADDLYKATKKARSDYARIRRESKANNYKG